MIDIKPLFYWHDDGNGNAYRVHLDDPSQRDYCEHCQEVYSSAVVDALRARIAELERPNSGINRSREAAFG